MPFYKNPFALVKNGVEKIGPVFSLKVANKYFTVIAGPEAIAFLIQGGPRILFPIRKFGAFQRPERNK